MLDGRHELRLQLALDPEPTAAPSAMRSARLAWSLVDGEATHHLVVQDDVWLPDGFGSLLHTTVAARPDRCLALFAEWGSRTANMARLAILVGAGSAEVIDDYIPTQALVLPAATARDLARHLSGLPDEGPPEDVAVMSYLQAIGAVPLVCVPNFVEHLDVPSSSLAGNAHLGERRSFCLQHYSAQVADGTLTGIDLVPHLSFRKGVATFLIRDEGRPDGWRSVPAGEVLSLLGVRLPDLAQAFERDLAEFGPLGTAPAGITSEHLLEIWLTAFSLGLRAAELAPAGQEQVLVALEGAAAQRAMASLFPGGLRHLLSRADLAALSLWTEPLALAATRAGSEAVTGAGTTGLDPLSILPAR